MKLPNLNNKPLTTGKFIDRYEIPYNQSNFTNWIKSNLEHIEDIVEVTQNGKYNKIMIVNHKKLYNMIKDGYPNFKDYITTNEFINKYELGLDNGNFTNWIKNNFEHIKSTVRIGQSKINKRYEIINDKKLFEIMKGE